ncbi:polysaccharide deacetylase family protein [bacterium]|nr:polysaccharide deacetylase family protein [bacterium]
MSLPGLLYHKIDDGFEAGLTRVSPSAFRRQISSLADRHWFFKSCIESFEIPGDADGVATLSFDDGYETLPDHVLSLLPAYGFTATVFIPTDWIGRSNRWDPGAFGIRARHMDERAIRTWSDAGMEVASHGASHTPLSLLPPSQWQRELQGSRERLEDITGRVVAGFSPPYGRLQQRHLDAVARAGYRYIAGVRPINLALPEGMYTVERLPVYRFEPPGVLQLKLDRSHPMHRLHRAVLYGIHQANTGSVFVQGLQLRMLRRGRRA